MSNGKLCGASLVISLRYSCDFGMFGMYPINFVGAVCVLGGRGGADLVPTDAERKHGVFPITGSRR